MNELKPLAEVVRNALKEHLEKIDQSLCTAGVSHTERVTICDEVESQILERLFQTDPQGPSLADLQAVLAEIDPPEAFAEIDGNTNLSSTPEKSSNRTELQVHHFAITSVSIITASLAVASLIIFGSSGDIAGIVVGFLGWLLAIYFSWEAIRAIRQYPDRYHGFGIAFLAVTLPIFILICSLIGVGVEAVADYVRYAKSDKEKLMNQYDSEVIRWLHEKQINEKLGHSYHKPRPKAPNLSRQSWVEKNEPVFVAILWMAVFPLLSSVVALIFYLIYRALRPARLVTG